MRKLNCDIDELKKKTAIILKNIEISFTHLNDKIIPKC